jgi:hypothetical protein
MQGYLFSKPVSGSEISDLLAGVAWQPAELTESEEYAFFMLDDYELERTG